MMDGMSWSEDVEDCAVSALKAAADPGSAPKMRAYMKNVAPFFGVPSPARSAALREAWKDIAEPAETELADAAHRLFAHKEREIHYAAIDLLGRFVRPARSRIAASFLAEFGEEFVTTKSWWDTVDGLRSELIGPLVARNVELVALMQQWNASDNIWLVRSSIIHQLGRKQTTDADLLFEFCANRAADKEFFIAKAIGWALRDYSYSDPRAVERFIAATPLQPLSVREGLKAIKRSRDRAAM
jgi:3-methyladenine DNA glycosylase AlkD